MGFICIIVALAFVSHRDLELYMTVFDFYLKSISSIPFEPTDQILVVCGGELDKKILQTAGLKNVTITNLSEHDAANNYSNYRWEKQDAEYLNYQNKSFDWTIVHAGLHHCMSPHKAICEMLRVSRKGIVCIESRDSIILRILKSAGFVSSYEIEAVFLTNGKYGGLRGGEIPNYVYRWTEAEVKKTVRSAEPHYLHDFKFLYDWRIPTRRFSSSRNIFKKCLSVIGPLFEPVLKLVLKRQGNCFAFIITNTGKLQPWIKAKSDSFMLDMDYAGRLYDGKKFHAEYAKYEKEVAKSPE